MLLALLMFLQAVTSSCSDKASCPDVCAFDPYCCASDENWDQQCINEATVVCDCDDFCSSTLQYKDITQGNKPKGLPANTFEDGEVWTFAEGQDAIYQWDNVVLTDEPNQPPTARKQSGMCPFAQAPTSAISDLSGATTVMKNFCQSTYFDFTYPDQDYDGDGMSDWFSKLPDDILVNPPTSFARSNPLCITPGQTTYTSAKVVATSKSLGDYDFDNTGGSTPQSFSVTSSGSYTVSTTKQTTATLALDASVSVEADAEVVKGTVSVGVTATASASQGTDKTATQSWAATLNPMVPAGCHMKGTIVQTGTQSEGDWTVPMCLSGTAWCHWNDRFHGHYYFSQQVPPQGNCNSFVQLQFDPNTNFGAVDSLLNQNAMCGPTMPPVCSDHTGSYALLSDIKVVMKYTRVSGTCHGEPNNVDITSSP
jgi:hypothetical protein